MTERVFISRLKFCIIIALIVFFISGNKAWLNPARSSNIKVIRTLDKVPLFWQYNPDAVQFIMTATYFPKFYKTHSHFISRPTLPAVAHFSGKILGFITSPFIELSPLYLTCAGWLIFKFILYVAVALALLSIYNRYLPENFSRLGVILALFSMLPLYYAGEFHTIDTNVFSPILMVYLFLKLKDNYSHKNNFIFSFVVGVLILTKENYACYLAIILFCLYHRKFLPAVISLAFHLIPMFLYNGFISYHDLTLTYMGDSPTLKRQGTVAGVWFLDFMNENDLISTVNLVLKFFREGFISFTSYYSILSLLILGGLIISMKKNIYFQEIIFAGLLLAATWLQMFAKNIPYWYMAGDCSVVFMGFVVFFLKFLLEKWDFMKPIKNIMVVAGIMWLILNILKMTHFPWVHPYDQNHQIFTKSINKIDDKFR
jgi:hypothetical protein